MPFLKHYPSSRAATTLAWAACAATSPPSASPAPRLKTLLPSTLTPPRQQPSSSGPRCCGQPYLSRLQPALVGPQTPPANVPTTALFALPSHSPRNPTSATTPSPTPTAALCLAFAAAPIGSPPTLPATAVLLRSNASTTSPAPTAMFTLGKTLTPSCFVVNAIPPGTAAASTPPLMLPRLMSIGTAQPALPEATAPQLLPSLRLPALLPTAPTVPPPRRMSPTSFSLALFTNSSVNSFLCCSSTLLPQPGNGCHSLPLPSSLRSSFSVSKHTVIFSLHPPSQTPPSHESCWLPWTLNVMMMMMTGSTLSLSHTWHALQAATSCNSQFSHL